jgi:multiple sugar transport system ATP-binding protein
MLYTNFEGNTLVARLDARSTFTHGQVIKLAVDMNKVHFFDKETDSRIR